LLKLLEPDHEGWEPAYAREVLILTWLRRADIYATREWYESCGSSVLKLLLGKGKKPTQQIFHSLRPVS